MTPEEQLDLSPWAKWILYRSEFLERRGVARGRFFIYASAFFGGGGDEEGFFDHL
jgi:hypothetical protein